MSDNQHHAPLSQAIVRTLTDKLYEKRKAAALEIEKQARDYVRNDNMVDLERLIKVLEQLATAPNGNTRKGGLIGLAATAIGLGNKFAIPYAQRLLEPVFACFSDADSRVRYFACEALYNIVKIVKMAALEHFEQLFDILWKLSSDPDQNVRNGSELLDRLVKEIVVSKHGFDLEALILLIRERIYSVNSSNRRFIISWLYTTLTVPEFSIGQYFPEVIDGVFKALEDPSPAVREATITVLTEMLHKLEPKEGIPPVDICSIVNVLVVQANSQTDTTRELSVQWMDQITVYYGDRILPQLSSFLLSILPHLESGEQGQIARSDQLNQRLTELLKFDSPIPVEPTVEVLLAHLRHERMETRMATLNWIRHLHSIQSNNMFRYMDRFFPILLELLSDPADDVLMLDIMLITEICGQPKQQQQLDIRSLRLGEELNQELKSVSPYLVKFSVALLKMFKDDDKLIDERGIHIVRQVCLLLEPTDVFRSLALLLGTTSTTMSLSMNTKDPFPDLQFVAKMVRILNQILMTTSCFPFGSDSVARSKMIPICLLSLYLLSQNYQHALELIPRLSEIDITFELLTEVDRVVQLIESPILAYVRMDLLHPDHQKPLSALLSALLMLLPQSDAFAVLQKRLQAVPHLAVLDGMKKTGRPPPSVPSSAKIKFKELIQHFDKVTAIRLNASRFSSININRNLLSFTATTSTVGMFLCGLQICSRIRKRGSTDGTGVAPFFLTSVSCICWLGYGLLRRDQTVIFVNGVGLVFQTVYLIYYYTKTRLKSRLNRLIFLEMVISVITAMVINGDLLNENEKENLLGVVCMLLNIATIASPLVDVGQVVRTKSTESLPFMLCVANMAVCVQWLFYGFLVDDFYMKLSLFIIYPRTYKQLAVGQV
uniref:Protein VAC14 homolog n=1 Tax=Globodera rostochiensis TaxID=31243 RepID=A0A914GXU8_GLORO